MQVITEKTRLGCQIQMYPSVAFGPLDAIPDIDRQTGRLTTSRPGEMDAPHPQLTGLDTVQLDHEQGLGRCGEPASDGREGPPWKEEHAKTDALRTDLKVSCMYRIER